EIAQMSVIPFADRSLERNGRLRNPAGLPHSFDAQVHPPGQLFRSGLAAELLYELASAFSKLIDDLDHVNRHTDGACLVRDGARDGLANPPSSVRGELVPAAPVEPFGALYEPEVAFLDQVEKLQTGMGVFLGDRNDKAKVGLGQFILCLVRLRLTTLDERESAFETTQSNFARLFDLLQHGAAHTPSFASLGGDTADGSVHAALEAACVTLHGMQVLDS